MDYLLRARAVLGDPQHWKPWCRTLLLFALPYPRAAGSFRGGGRVARYALGRDYHHVLGRRLEKLGRRLRESGAIRRFRAVTDAAPLLEREWALRGALGFRGKNTLVLDPAYGAWQLFGELLVDADWPAWSVEASFPSCGSCTRCLDACPTDAFPEPYQLDPRRCISYLTIEHRGPMPMELRAAVGDWVFGCDVCMEVCPFGDAAHDHARDWGTTAALARWSLEELLACRRGEFEAAFRGTPLRRPGWAGLLRNAAVALGNLRRGAGALGDALGHPEPLVRGHAAWALGCQGEAAPLRRAAGRESDPWVQEEIQQAIAKV